MTYDQMEMLEAVVEFGSFQGAAKKLHKSQPSLSVGIKKIEEEYQIQLFHRDGYRSKLTEQGSVFFRSCKEALEAFRSTQRLATELGLGVEPEIKFVLDSLTPLARLNHILSDLTGEDINTTFKFEMDIMAAAPQSIIDQNADFAVGALFIQDPQIELKPYGKIRLAPVISSKWKNNKMTLDFLRCLPQIITSTSRSKGVSAGILDGGKKWYVTEHYLKEQLILEGLGWGHLAISEMSSNQQKKIVQIKNPRLKSSTIDFFLMKNRKRALGPIAKRIWGMF